MLWSTHQKEATLFSNKPLLTGKILIKTCFTPGKPYSAINGSIITKLAAKKTATSIITLAMNIMQLPFDLRLMMTNACTMNGNTK